MCVEIIILPYVVHAQWDSAEMEIYLLFVIFRAVPRLLVNE